MREVRRDVRRGEGEGRKGGQEGEGRKRGRKGEGGIAPPECFSTNSRNTTVTTAWQKLKVNSASQAVHTQSHGYAHPQ